MQSYKQMFEFTQFSQAIGRFLDFAGVVVVLLGVAIATGHIIYVAFFKKGVHHLYKTYRQNLARSILIGLEFLVAGDIIRSVGGNLSLDSVVILAIIVLIRSLLGVEFEMEIEGRWPWKASEQKK